MIILPSLCLYGASGKNPGAFAPGRGKCGAHLLSYEDLSLNLISREVKRGADIIDLQPLEFSLLEYLLRNKERVVSKNHDH